MIADRAFDDAQNPSGRGGGLTSPLQDTDRDDLLPCELRQRDASGRAWFVQDQLERPRLACRWMFSTTAVLAPCQARNDSGSLTPSFTGLVTTRNNAANNLVFMTSIISLVRLS